jgi:hypothetical protein
MDQPPQPLPYAAISPPPIGDPPVAGGLTQVQLAELARARIVGRKVGRATAVATVDGWTTGIFGGLSIILSFGSVPGILLGAGMAMIAWFQLRSAQALKQLDLEAPKRLARHQLVLGLLLFAYAAFSLWQGLTNPSLLSEATKSDPQVAEILSSYGMDDLARTVYTAVYGSMMVIAVIGTGLAALYYSTRQKHVKAYHEATPQWILDLQRAGMKL